MKSVWCKSMPKFIGATVRTPMGWTGIAVGMDRGHDTVTLQDAQGARAPYRWRKSGFEWERLLEDDGKEITTRPEPPPRRARQNPWVRRFEPMFEEQTTATGATTIVYEDATTIRWTDAALRDDIIDPLG